MIQPLGLCFATILLIAKAHAFNHATVESTRVASSLFLGPLNEENRNGPCVSRRDAGIIAVDTAIASCVGFVGVDAAQAEDGYRPAKRPTAYRVDSTQPPTLIPVEDARSQLKVLEKLGKGSGTDKDAVVNDTINLNNILNKAVFGSIEAISGLVGGKEDPNSGTGYASFVCMGIPSSPTSADFDLAGSLLQPIIASRKAEAALGLSSFPLSSQPDLDSFCATGDERILSSSLAEKGVEKESIDLYMPLLRQARNKSLNLLALAPEKVDIVTARAKGLQDVDPDRRKSYVVDAEGFIALSQDPRFRVYTERSLLKDFQPKEADERPGGFFAERILVHETAATIVSKYAVQHPDSLVTVVAPVSDLRFLQGINGRIPRVCQFLNPSQNKVTDNAVTTILLNPTASETLSLSRYLRLEIGTGPDTLDYQSKVADYLWFSSPPKVNTIPRLMNA